MCYLSVLSRISLNVTFNANTSFLLVQTIQEQVKGRDKRVTELEESLSTAEKQRERAGKEQEEVRIGWC